MENRTAGKKVKDRRCEWCDKEYTGRSLFCCNECFMEYRKLNNNEYQAMRIEDKKLDLQEKLFDKRERVFMRALELEIKGIPTVNKALAKEMTQNVCVDKCL